VGDRSLLSLSGTGADAVNGHAGEYQRLYVYLRDRYANCVVLTFTQIEDLLGFVLPEPARHEAGWWGTGDASAARSEQSASWTLASRTATVNLSAQRVMFERAP
jgi:hypothetical protein